MRNNTVVASAIAAGILAVGAGTGLAIERSTPATDSSSTGAAATDTGSGSQSGGATSTTTTDSTSSGVSAPSGQPPAATTGGS